MSERHILIVGGSKGLGRQTALFLLSQGWRVTVISRSTPEGFPETDRYQFRSFDLISGKDLPGLLSEITDNCGAITAVAFCQRYRGSDNPWEGEIACSIDATRRFIETLALQLKLQNLAIDLVSSVNAKFTSPGIPLSYHVAKSGLLQLVRYFAVTLGKQGIRINSVSPGSYLKQESAKGILVDKNLVALNTHVIPLGRMCVAQEVVNAIEFLVSEKSSFITGQDLVVDGGISLVYQEVLAKSVADFVQATPQKI